MKLSHKDVKDRKAENLRTAELRVVISRAVGLNHDPRLRFGLADLNSIHAYLTGNWYYEREVYGTSNSPDPEDIRFVIADKLGFEKKEYPSAFNEPILRKLAEEVRNKSDRRP